ncbi:histidine acid phosphatase [Thozetella sp. PMI_491]|nr:histidine acid phosphatase [Thozetella sp. PMI_491]
MPVSRTLRSLALVGPALAAAQVLAPAQDINFPSSGSAVNPLQWLGANGPYFAGPNVNNIDPEVPENCYVDQVATVSRHGSRYPDQGAYNGWVDMQTRFDPKNGYTASGSLSFLPEWRTVLTNPSLQIAMESPTGYKESYDFGYTLRTRYPQLYNEGDDFFVWSNNYTRVLQTASMFVRGFLGPAASTLGNVVSVTSKNFAAGVGDSLAPSDMCPNFKDTEGATQQANWTSVFLAPIKSRLQAMVSGNLTFTDNDILQMPYLCGFESQITGRLSPWCGVWTDDELKDYEYYNDLRYWYGVGAGTDLPAKMMTPYLNALVGVLQQGPGINGTNADGSSFELPRLVSSFLNDGQITELATAMGIFDEQAPLDPFSRDDNRLFMASRFISMRGTVAFERLNCIVSGSSNSSTSTSASVPHGNGTSTGRPSSSASSISTGRPGNNTTLATSTRSASLSSTATVTDEPGSPITIGTTVTTTICPTATPSIVRRDAGSYNATYLRIRLNDAVYPVPSCKNGPGSSCLLSDYADYVAKKYAVQGNWATNCNVTLAGAPTTVKGASFYTDLSSPWLQIIPPY